MPFFKDAASYFSFIGCVIIRRSIWMERQRERYFGSLFIHMGVIFQAPIPGRILVVARTLISIRYGNALWRAKEFEIWMFKWPDLLLVVSTASVRPRRAAGERSRPVAQVENAADLPGQRVVLGKRVSPLDPATPYIHCASGSVLAPLRRWYQVR